jgi:hypothetical protein
MSAAAALGAALARPKTDAARQRAAQLKVENDEELKKTRLQCREACDTESDMCRRRM